MVLRWPASSFFTSHICDWYRNEYDCYLSHSISENYKVLEIYEEDAFELVNNNDDNEDQIHAAANTGANNN